MNNHLLTLLFENDLNSKAAMYNAAKYVELLPTLRAKITLFEIFKWSHSIKGVPKHSIKIQNLFGTLYYEPQIEKYRKGFFGITMKIDSEKDLIDYRLHSFSHKYPMLKTFELHPENILTGFERTRLLLA